MLNLRRLAGVVLSAIAVSVSSAAPERREINGVDYHLLKTSPESVEIVWKGATDEPLRTFPQAKEYLEATGRTVETLMNGGIFEPGGIPSGLLIQSGKELNPVNRRDGKGNFFLKPNGIFLISKDGAAVIDTTEYPGKHASIRCAVQSGPLLLRNSRIHPAFNADSESRLHRNGVGVTKDGKVLFVMSDRRSPKLPNLHEFASLFLELGCADALFLDGDLSQMRSGGELDKYSNQFGSIIAVMKPAD
ncbi:DUF2233 domain-containing protein [Haloferula helveola]|uniref:DUF2233 domain-containing protein n=1 Tax=Haloferula helveola TaxID=490095 RepID=A0ABM7RJ89_9BACT|nr:DUF2233 domain-containing protein [Haloferula helveola]